MKIVREVDKMQVYSRVMKKEGKMIGFVPTMGYLHEGHESLLNTARKQSDIVITSIFVNPVQFGPGEDYQKYPRDIARDEEIARSANVDVIFYPSKEDMYPEGYSTYVDVKNLTKHLCGVSRPQHFTGVATIVTKLFNIVKPDIAYFGQKDAQQAIIIKKVVSDLNLDVMIKVLPIVREEDGLAVSSRNVYLNKKEREDAAILYQSLKRAAEMFTDGERESRKIIKGMEDLIKERDTAKIDYAKIVNTQSLKDVNRIKEKALVALAVFIGKTRLIDNIFLGDKDDQ